MTLKSPGMRHGDKQPDEDKEKRCHTGARLRIMFPCAFTSSEMSSLLGKFWLTAAREACSMSRIHLLMLSIDESHSRCPGALSLRSRRRRRAITWLKTEIGVKLRDGV